MNASITIIDDVSTSITIVKQDGISVAVIFIDQKVVDLHY